MARKSRKKIEAEVMDAPAAAKIWNVGAYVRLSAVDRKHKGDSIENQQSIIGAFVAERSDMALREVYIDNGTTGQTFEREGFRRMLADMESGTVNCCVSKDLSRLGRNAIDTGYYIEKYFPAHGIRYVAITDNYDSADGESGGTVVSLKNLINETYALDVGRKIRATAQMNIRNGGFAGSVVPYGYFKSAEDRHKLVVDPEAGAVVRQIFKMYADGHSVLDIARYFTASGILPPRCYLASKGMISKKLAGKHTLWNRCAVYHILLNRIYVGDMVQHKTSAREHVRYRLPQTEWIITPATHEGIVSRELFDRVQKKRPEQQPRITYESDNVFLRKIFCGHCGSAMVRNRGNGKYEAAAFICGSRQSYGKDACTPVRIKEKALKTEILELLRKQVEAFADFRKLQSEKTSDGNQRELIQTKAELTRIDGFLKGLYENLVSGNLTNAEYTELKQHYETRTAAIKERERQLRKEIHNRRMRESELKKAGDYLDGVSVISDLTAETISALIEKILVFEDKHIEVMFRFSDEIRKTEGEANE